MYRMSRTPRIPHALSGVYSGAQCRLEQAKTSEDLAFTPLWMHNRALREVAYLVSGRIRTCVHH